MSLARRKTKADRIAETRELVQQWQALRREGRCSLEQWILLKTMSTPAQVTRRLEEAEIDVWAVSQEGTR